MQLKTPRYLTFLRNNAAKLRAAVIAEPKIIDGFTVTAGALMVLWWLA